MKREHRSSSLFSAALALAAAFGAVPACRSTTTTSPPPQTPSVRLYFMSTVAGALEPCGCRKDMLGGVDHAAALLAAKQSEAPERLLLAAGPLLFQDPLLSPERRDQDIWKAEALAAALEDLKLGAWAPGINDFAAGAEKLAQLVQPTGARLLGANIATPPIVAPTAFFQLGAYKVGVAGIAAAPETTSASADPAPALAAALEELNRGGAQIRVALVSMSRGAALRLVERVAGFDVVALGKASDQGEANDAPFPPALVGETLVLQAPNHLQALAYVDLFVKGEDFAFADASRIAETEKRESLTQRISDLERRAKAAVDAEARRGFETQLERSRAELGLLTQKAAATETPPSSFFRYHLVEVKESSGSEPRVARRMLEYYRHVNEHNRVALKDRTPLPVPSGSARYVGGSACTGCHADAEAFWQKSEHATAYETLTSEFKEFNLDCVGCHVTGYNRPGGSTVTHVSGLEDVQCEACHGPGSRHVDSSGDTSLITLTPAEATCRSCHHTPHVLDDWDARAAWGKIIGPGHGKPKSTASE